MADGSSTLTIIFGGAALALSVFTLLSGRERKGGSSDHALADLAKRVADHDDKIAENSKDVADVSVTLGRHDERLKGHDAEIGTLRDWRHNVNGEAARILAQSLRTNRER